MSSFHKLHRLSLLHREKESAMTPQRPVVTGDKFWQGIAANLPRIQSFCSSPYAEAWSMATASLAGNGKKVLKIIQ